MEQDDREKIEDVRMDIAVIKEKVSQMFLIIEKIPMHCLQQERLTKLETSFSVVKWCGMLLIGWVSGIFQWLLKKFISGGGTI